MPGFDGTGPEGHGAATGRGRGNCVKWPSTLIGKTAAALFIPAAGVIVKDIRSPEGIIRKLYQSLKLKISGRSGKRIGKEPENLLDSANHDKNYNVKKIKEV